MKSQTKRWGAFLAVLLVALFSIGAFAACTPQPDKISYHETEIEGTLRVAIISDTQLPSSPDVYGYSYQQNLDRALEYYAQRGIDALLFAGDFTEQASPFAYQSYLNSYNNVFKWSDVREPVKLYIMGNHEYYYGGKAAMQRRFKKYLGESPWSHKVIGGYHFINCSPPTNDYWGSHKQKLKWLRNQLEIAQADAPMKPIFVNTHYGPKETAYGTYEWGTADLNELFAEYPQVVSFSGHSHYSLLDERSIAQDEGYTAVQTQSLSYTELEDGKENGTKPPRNEENPMGIYMIVQDDVVTMERISFREGAEGPVKEPWTIDFKKSPPDRNRYTSARAADRPAPYFEAGASAEQTSVEGVPAIRIDAANHTDFVHSYKIVLKDANGNIVKVEVPPVYEYSTGKTVSQRDAFWYFSDFVAGDGYMHPSLVFQLSEHIPKGGYTAEIYAAESFGKLSINYLTCSITI